MKYITRTDGEGFEIPSRVHTRFACCKCGLVHDIIFVSHDGKPIGIAAKVNKLATAARRRGKAEELK